jgi:hypothetical protein
MSFEVMCDFYRLTASEEFFLLQLKCDLLIGVQDRGNAFRNTRNRENAAERLQRFAHCQL